MRTLVGYDVAVVVLGARLPVAHRSRVGWSTSRWKGGQRMESDGVPSSASARVFMAWRPSGNSRRTKNGVHSSTRWPNRFDAFRPIDRRYSIKMY
jgi:hypothetical protein